LDINSNNTSLADHTYGALTLIHEIGHSLGLKLLSNTTRQPVARTF
jgi:predicted Zn-dependent protease with MMP-like domain